MVVGERKIMRKRLLGAASLFALTLACGLVGGHNPAVAACGTNSGSLSASVFCDVTGAGNNADIVLQNGTTVNVTVTDISAAVRATSDANATITLEGVTINHNSSAVGTVQDTVLARSSASGSGSASVIITGGVNTINPLAADPGNGILAEVQNLTGSALVRIDANATLNITDNGVGNEKDGIEATVDANAGAAGDAVIQHDGLGTVSVHGGNAVFARSRGGTGNVTVSISQSGVTLNVDNSAGVGNHAGIQATSLDGLVTVNNAATINASGAGALGISAQAQGLGDVSINNSGVISAYDYGIWAQATSGTSTITSTGNVTTTNDQADAIRVDSVSGDVTIDASGTIVTHAQVAGVDGAGTNAHGIVVAYPAGGAAGAVEVNYTGPLIDVNGASSDAIVVVNDSGPTKITNSGALVVRGQNGSGIELRGGGSGNLSIQNTGSITTFLTNSAGIRANVTSGDIDIDNGGNITSGGVAASSTYGIYAAQTASGNVLVRNTATISNISSDASAGILAASGFGTITVYNGGTILAGDVTSSDNVGIQAQTSAGGIINVTNEGSIQTHGFGGAAIYSVTASGGNTVISSGSLATDGDNAVALSAHSTAGGNVTINASGAINTTATLGGVVGAGLVAHGLLGQNDAGGVTNIVYTGPSIDVDGTASSAIIVLNATGSSSISNSGALIVRGAGGAGIEIRGGTENSIIDNSGSITTFLANSVGIKATVTSGSLNINNSGSITTGSATSSGNIGIYGVALGAGSVAINNSGDITTNGSGTSIGIAASAQGGGNATVVSDGANITTLSANDSPHGMEAMSTQGLASLTFRNGIISVNAVGAAGLVAWDGGADLGGSSAEITIENGIINHSASGQAAILVNTVESGVVKIDGSSEVHGGWDTASAISIFRALDQRIENAGVIDALSDVAIASHGGTGFNLTNTGTITGTVSADVAATSFDNSGLWNIRNFKDSNGDGIRETIAVAVNDFGTSGANSITNNGRIALLGHNEQATVLDNTGEYLPLGNTNNAMSLNSPVQGHIYNVQTFTNNGVIDLQANSSVGDVMVISGGSVAGTNGGGVFVTGGSVLLDTVLNAGGSASQSDVLVVDSTKVGSGATSLIIHATGAGAQTVGDGILLVQVLGSSDQGAFKLGNRVTGGIYTYSLFQGGDTAAGGNAADGNWYLRSSGYREEITVDVVAPAQAVAVSNALIDGMSDMLSGLHDGAFGEAGSLAGMDGSQASSDGDGSGGSRGATATCTDPKNPKKKVRCKIKRPVQLAQPVMYKGAWARVIATHGEYGGSDFSKNGPRYDSDLWGIQAGFELYGSLRSDGSRDIGGLFVGTVNSTADVKSLTGGKAGKSDIDAYSVGAYWTHYSTSGWYVQGIVQGSYYESDISSVTDTKVSVDGYGFATSVSGGYKYNLGRGFSLEPQAQLVYQYVGFDSYRNSYNIVTQDNMNDIRGRLGLRLSQNVNIGDEKAPRSLNWWASASVWHSFTKDQKTSFFTLDGQYQDALKTPVGGTWAELGAGVTGQVTANTSLFANSSYYHNLDDHDRQVWSGRVGVQVKW